MTFRFQWLDRIIRLTCLMAVILLPACTAFFQNPVQTINVGMESSAVNTLIIIADRQNFFSTRGLKVSITTYPSGLAAVNGMLNKEVDLATASEFVLVGQTFAGTPIRTLASIDRFMHNYLIARKDRGIQTGQDLRGKKVGFTFKTAAEFYLGRYLDLNGLSLKEVTPINLGPGDLVRALVDGEVDAVVAWQPYAKTILDQMEDRVARWPVQSDQVTYGNLFSTVEWTESHPEAVRYFLQALIEAETFVANNPEEARAILKDRLSYDDAFMTVIWEEHQFQVSLEQSMVLAMEDEARWMINNKLVPHKQIPDFATMIYTAGMQSVQPDAVNIIH